MLTQPTLKSGEVWTPALLLSLLGGDMETSKRRFVGGETLQHVPVLSLECRVGEFFLVLGKKLGSPAIERGLPARQGGVQGRKHPTHPGNLLERPGIIPTASLHGLQDAAVERPASSRTLGIDGARSVEAGAGLPKLAVRVQWRRYVLALLYRHRPEQRPIAAESAGKAEILGSGGHLQLNPRLEAR